MPRPSTWLPVCYSTPVYSLFLFFFIIPPPPRSTLFPYTTLFRSVLGTPAESRILRSATASHAPNLPAWKTGKHRSEEHTSELQSRQYLVCRLLLEKKKKTS